MLWVRAGAQRYGGYGASLQAYPPLSFLPRLFLGHLQRSSVGAGSKAKEHHFCQKPCFFQWARYLLQTLEFFHPELWSTFYLEKNLQ